MSKWLLIPALLLVLTSRAGAQQTIVLVRHAERADSQVGASPTMGADPDLSDAGRARAESLAAILEDAGITAIFTTEYRRTQQTAAPLAKALGITPTVLKATDAAALAKALRAVTGNALVVGHSNTLPETIKSLGVSSPLTIDDDEYDNLLIVTGASSPSVLRLRYR